ncbi:segregation and condensation protein A [Amaricoccus macauensis]|uniref:segregation and condensation protein A n=1 Tax=Amaricoccus macauensis TaxID=57001 RepID=UPI003C7D2C7D
MPDDFFDEAATAERIAAEALVVEVDGYEGPLDLLLTLARGQKVDLRKISVLKLAEQYLAFVEEAKRLRIELAADYLVMAAWLAFLKSRLLLPPDPKDEGPSGEDLAEHLAFQLQRLEAMRRAAAQLMARDQLGRDMFARGEPQAVAREAKVEHQASLMDLLKAYSRIKTKSDFRPLHLEREPVYTMEQALERMRGLLGNVSMDWLELSAWLPEDWRREPKKRRSAMAASFAAALELVKAGRLDVRQDGTFQPILLRRIVKEDEQ